MNKRKQKRFIIAGVVGLLLICLSTLALIWAITSNRLNKNPEFNTFASCADLAGRLNQRSSPPYWNGGFPSPGVGVDDNDGGLGSGDGRGEEESPDFSDTNVQVKGVDEADILKTDGNYVYIITESKLSIIDVRNPRVELTKTDLKLSGRPVGMFINGDSLVIVTSSDHYYPYPYLREAPGYWSSNRSEVRMSVYDICDKANPEQTRTVAMDGSYKTARMKDGHIYLMNQYYPTYYGTISAREAEALLPRIADVKGAASPTNADYIPMTGCQQTSYYGTTGTTFTTVVAISLKDNATKTQKAILGGAEAVYMSLNNIYFVASEYDYGTTPTRPQCDPLHVVAGLCPEPDIAPPQKEPEVSSHIFRLSVDKLKLEFAAAGSVPGTILNQFSLDEQSGYLRIATTKNSFFGWTSESENNVFILNEGLETVGSLEGIAKGERIYSTRFLDDRVYMVTFKTIDPLFVIDLSKPSNPKILGELKIPGYSDYLHPYDENHIIGFGKDTEDISDTAAIQKGLKIALFDVTNPESPKEISKLILGGRGSDSELLRDHKALLFDRERKLLVIPVSLAAESTNIFDYSPVEFTGFIAMSIDAKEGLKEQAQLKATNSPYSYWYGADGMRSLYINDVLFTWDGTEIQAYELASYEELKSLKVR